MELSGAWCSRSPQQFKPHMFNQNIAEAEVDLSFLYVEVWWNCKNKVVKKWL